PIAHRNPRITPGEAHVSQTVHANRRSHKRRRAESSRVDGGWRTHHSLPSGEGVHLHHVCGWTRCLARKRKRHRVEPSNLSRGESYCRLRPERVLGRSDSEIHRGGGFLRCPQPFSLKGNPARREG